MIHEVDLNLRLLVPGDAALPVPAVFRYDTADPCAVHSTFHVAGDTVEWVFARDLLYGGLTNDMGIGDVRVWPSSDHGDRVMYIALSSPDGDALLELPLNEVRAFLDFTARIVPFGSESYDLDTIIQNIIAEY